VIAMIRRWACVGAGVLVALGGCKPQHLVLNNVNNDSADASSVGSNTTDTAADPGADAPSSNPQCGPVTLYQQSAPVVTILLDRSSNMGQSFDGTTKLAGAQQLLSGNIANYGQIVFKLGVFPADTCSGKTCCAESIEETQFSNYLQCPPLCASATSDSPSQYALQQVKAPEGQFPPPSYVLLVTGSDPSCASDASSADSCTAAVTAAKNLDNSGIPVVVLGLGDGGDCFGQLNGNNVPALPSGISPFYNATSIHDAQQHLNTLFTAVEEEVCTLTGYSAVAQWPGWKLVKVTVGDTQIPPANWTEMDGSAWPGQVRIKLSGDYCKNLLGSPDASQLDFQAWYYFGATLDAGAEPCPSNDNPSGTGLGF